MADPLSINDQMVAYFAAFGFTTGDLNDRYYAYLGSLGYTGSLEDRIKAWCGNGAGDINDLLLAKFAAAGYSTGSYMDRAYQFWSHPVAAPTAPPVAGYSIWLPSDGRKWQDAARTIPATADGASVASWEDYSGNGNHAVQATAAAQPILKTALLNSQNVVRYDGVNDSLTAPYVSGVTGTTFIVVKLLSGTNVTFWALDVAASVAQFYVNLGEFRYYAPDTSEGGNPAIYNITALTYESLSVVKPRIGGGAALNIVDPNDNYVGSSVMFLGGITGASGNFEIAEVIQYPTALSLANHDLVGNYLALKFARSWTPAA